MTDSADSLLNIANAAWMIPSYAERKRYGERVSTGFIESTVNMAVGKRFGKRQQIRTPTLDGTLRRKFEQWYPAMKQASSDRVAA